MTYTWTIDYFERYRDSEGKYICTDNIKETRGHREEFAIINNLPALKLEYEPVDRSKKGKYFVTLTQTNTHAYVQNFCRVSQTP